MSGRCRRVSGWYLWKLDVLGCVLGSHPLQYGAVTLFWHRPERHHFFSPDHTETSKYQNVHIWGWQKWLGYMISLFLSARQKDIKNGSCIWTPCICILYVGMGETSSVSLVSTTVNDHCRLTLVWSASPQTIILVLQGIKYTFPIWSGFYYCSVFFRETLK